MLLSEGSQLAERLARCEAKQHSGEDLKDDDECAGIVGDLQKVKATLTQTKSKLEECKKRRAELAEALRKCEDARKVLGEKLEACLQAKAKLTEAVKNCHENLRRTREALNLCLSKKKQLNESIKRCHEAKEAAQAKWDECERQKKKMHAAIAQLRQALAEGEGSASLLQIGSRTKAEEQLKQHQAKLKEVEDDYEVAATDLEKYHEELEDLMTTEKALDKEMKANEADGAVQDAEEENLRAQLEDEAEKMAAFIAGLQKEDMTQEEIAQKLIQLAALQEDVKSKLEEHAIIADATLDELEIRDMDPGAPMVGEPVEGEEGYQYEYEYYTGDA